MIWFVYVPRRTTFRGPYVSESITNEMMHMARTRDECIRRFRAHAPPYEHRHYTPEHAVKVRLERQ